MKEFLKNVMLNLNEDESESDDISKNYDLINLFKKTAKNNNYDYDYKLNDERMLNNQNKDYYEPRLMDDNVEINPFLIDKKKYGNSLKKLFINTETNQNSFGNFNTETKIDLFGGLTLWQFTAIIFAMLIFVCLTIYLFRKFNMFIMHKEADRQAKEENLTSFRTSSVRTSYSLDSSNNLLPKSMNTFRSSLGDNFKLQSNYSLKPAPHYA